MNVNGARFRLLLGAADWGRCTSTTGEPLSEIWAASASSGQLPAEIPGWDEARALITLAPRTAALPATSGEPIYDQSSRRGAVSDRHGNLYFVSDDRAGLRVEAVNSADPATAFWPDPREHPTHARIFADAAPAVPEPRHFGPIAITCDDFLIASFGPPDSPATGVLRFDLIAGGPPETLVFPAGFAPRIADLAAHPCGGLWMLAADAIHILDSQMAPCAIAAPVLVPALFQPETGEPRQVRTPAAISGTPAPADARAIAALGDCLVILSAPPAADASLHILEPGAAAPRPLGPVPGRAYVLAAAPGDTLSADLLLAAPNGNQAWRIRLDRIDNQWTARPQPDIVPLRRFGGRALVLRRGSIVYDTGPHPLWVPAIAQPRRVHAVIARFVTPPMDGHEPQCLWDRLRLDACIPPGCTITIEARAGDDAESLVPGEAGWTRQPTAYLAADTDLPGKRPFAIAATDRAQGRGCWDLLLQAITGRHLQLRITLSGDGRFTPHLRALRAWFPRVSWTRLLPAIYRSDPGPADFLDRFLANFEGISSGIEGQIASAQTRFDPRTAPSESLEWLAGWYDTALDPAWSDDRRRLFIAHAAAFFGWRGTIRGLGLALRLAFDPDVTPRDFDLADPPCDAPAGIRIIENYTVRTSAAPLAPAPAVPSTPGERSLEGDWHPEAARAGLTERWVRFTGAVSATTAQRAAPFDLAPADRDPALWSAFTRQHFGFTPAAGPAERARWQAFAASQGTAATTQPATETALWIAYTNLPSRQRAQWQAFLAARHRTIARLNAAWGTLWSDFTRIPIPDVLPESPATIRDWLVFEGQVLPMAAAAHRFTILLPRTRTDHDPAADAADLALAQRIVALEKPAHTIFDVRFYWAMNRVGEACLGRDSQIGAGSRAPELIPGTLLGRTFIGAGFIAGPQSSDPAIRRQILC